MRAARGVRAAVAVAGLVVAPAVLATPAFADVTVQPADAVQGEEAAFSFVVPNDSGQGGIVKVRVSVPTAARLTSVRTQPLPGWTANVFKAKVPQPGDVCDCITTPTVTSITWTAHRGVSIAPGAFEEFAVLVERMPKQASMTFPTVQTYDNGRTVSWTAPTRRGAVAPAHAAPRLVLRPATDAAGDIVPAAAKSPAPAADPVARWLGLSGVALGLLALAVTVLGRLRRSSQADSTSAGRSGLSSSTT